MVFSLLSSRDVYVLAVVALILAVIWLIRHF